MTPRKAMIYLLWYGEKAVAGDEPTAEEFEKFKEARKVSMGMALRIMRIRPADYEYTPGRGFDGLVEKKGE